MKQTPIYDETQPIACTISSDEIPARIELIERMRSNLDRLERTQHGLLLHFPHDDAVEADVRLFAIDEKRCCSFWGFAIDNQPKQLTLRWDGPPGFDEFFHELVTFFEGDEPFTAFSGLL